MRRVKPGRLREIARSTFWLIPSICVFAAIVLAVGMLEVDHLIGQTKPIFLFPGPPSTARSFLSSIIQAMITFTGLVFSITIVVLQLTSGQFSPRVLRMFLRDRTIQFSLGVFLASFVYGMVVLRGVGTGSSEGVPVPRAALTGAFVLVIISVGMFIRYVAHVINLIRAATIIDSIVSEAREHLEQHFPADASPRRPVTLGTLCQQIENRRPGVLVAVNERVIIEAAAAAGSVVVLVSSIGDYVPDGYVVIRVHGEGSVDEDVVRGALSFDTERTLGQDLPFAFRQLVDIAQKGLSPSLNDPTTATQAIDAMHDLLRRLSSRHLTSGVHDDDDGVVRLIIPEMSFEGYMGLAVGQVWHYARDSVQVPQRLTEMLIDLRSVALPAYQAPIRYWLEQVGPEGQRDPTWQAVTTPDDLPGER